MSRQLCAQWDWRNGIGAFKDMAARALLLKLQERGLIELPTRRRTPTNRMQRRPGASTHREQGLIVGELPALGPLAVVEISRDAVGRAELAAALAKFHYLGYGGPVGQNVQYTVRTVQGRMLAGAVFGAAAWKCAAREHWIGWSGPQREQGLHLVANQARFLILPWVQVPRLASWILGQVAGRIAQDWQAKYGHRLVLLESFVERGRFAGSSYRAANWIWLGSTQGRSRQDQARQLQVPSKDIYVYELGRRTRQWLCS